MEPALPPPRKLRRITPNPNWLDVIKALRAHHPRWEELMQLPRLPARPDADELPAESRGCASGEGFAIFRKTVCGNPKLSAMLRKPSHFGDYYNGKGRHWMLANGVCLRDLIDKMLDMGAGYSVEGHSCPANCPSPAATDQYDEDGDDDEEDAPSADGSLGALAEIRAAMSDERSPLEKAVRDAEKSRRRALAAPEIEKCDEAITAAKRKRDSLLRQLERDIRTVDEIPLQEHVAALQRALSSACSDPPPTQ